MTVYELISLNQMITDIEIEIRDNHKLVDVLLYGCAAGVKPTFPRKVPESPQFIGNVSRQKEATYIPKSINSYDDGRDYWQVKPDRLPKGWKDLTVTSWEVWPAPCVGTTSPRRMNYGEGFKNVNFHGQRINMVAEMPKDKELPLPEPQPKQKNDEQIKGQMSIEDYI